MCGFEWAGYLHTRQFGLDVATDEVIADAGFFIEHTVGLLTETLDAALSGARPPTSPVEHAQQYDRDAIVEQAVTAYQRAVDGGW